MGNLYKEVGEDNSFIVADEHDNAYVVKKDHVGAFGYHLPDILEDYPDTVRHVGTVPESVVEDVASYAALAEQINEAQSYIKALDADRPLSAYQTTYDNGGVLPDDWYRKESEKMDKLYEELDSLDDMKKDLEFQSPEQVFDAVSAYTGKQKTASDSRRLPDISGIVDELDRPNKDDGKNFEIRP